MNILVTGGCGYIGSVLVPKLLELGHEVEVVDLQWFGNRLKPHTALTVRKIDVRDYVPLKGIDAIIHLAAIANDPCCELDGRLTWEVNALATARLIDHAARHKIKRFIYASSGSIYGVKQEQRVTEELSCEPLSDYNKSKMVAERVVLSYADRMQVQILRPATVCGYSPRQRLDVVVNMLTAQALSNGIIKVFGGSQMRPHVHMVDVVNAYVWMLDHPDLTGVFNVGFENITVMDLAEMVQRACGGDIVVKDSNDPRSYSMYSGKLLDTGFIRERTVHDAIVELVLHETKGTLASGDDCYNLKTMKFLGVAA